MIDTTLLPAVSSDDAACEHGTQTTDTGHAFSPVVRFADPTGQGAVAETDRCVVYIGGLFAGPPTTNRVVVESRPGSQTRLLRCRHVSKIRERLRCRHVSKIRERGDP